MVRRPALCHHGREKTNRGELIPLMETVTRTRTTAQWIKLLEDKAVPCGPINDIGQAFADEQVKARNLEVKQPALAGVIPAKTAIKSISTVASPCALPPHHQCYACAAGFGEHTDEVLREMGLDAEAIAALRVSGVV